MKSGLNGKFFGRSCSLISHSCSLILDGQPSLTPLIWHDLQTGRKYSVGMAGVELHSFNVKFLQL